MKKIFVFAVITAAMCFVSCGATKNVVAYSPSSDSNNNAKKNEAVVSEVSTSNIAKEAFETQAPVSVEMLDWGFGKSGDKAKAMRDALRSAQNNIAVRLYRTVSLVDTEFGEDIAKASKMTTSTKRSEMITGVIDSKVCTISYTKAPIFKYQEGVYECEIEVKLVPELLQNITTEIYNSLSADDELKVRFDEQQFFENVYKKTLEDFRNNQKK